MRTTDRTVSRRSARLVAGAAAALTVGALAAAPAVAADTTGPARYTGVFNGPVTYVPDDVGHPGQCDAGTHYASGSWRVSLHGNDGATARFVITVDGAPHVAYTTQMHKVAVGPGTFELTSTTAAGPLDVTLSADGTLRYTIAPYDYSPWGGFTCASVTYQGTADR
jgi:hypothetical protein